MAHVSLSKPLRNALQSAVMQGREVAEAGASEALAFYSIGAAKAPDHLSADQKAFRNKLRAHARQLGDLHADSGTQDTARLVDEVGYEQWNRILFTRFLVENGLLIHPEFEAPMSLADVAELAADEKREVWELASEFASKMLPQIFRPDAPTQQLRLPRNRIQELEKLVLALAPDTFKADDSLGWSYQFWQGKRKDSINAAGGSIGADELPAVTQLFTEDYMVEFLLQNSLGAWFKSNHPGKELSLDLPYLRFVPGAPAIEGSAPPEPAAGRFENWPKSLADFKVLDPCCGSGHFPVFLLHMLVPMRMVLEDISAKEAINAVLRDNIYGLELDPRCVEIAVFALALAAWTYPGTGGYRKLPAMNIACCGLPITQKKKDWVALAGDDEHLQNGMEALYLTFKDAPTLGSLLDPLAAVGDMFEAGFLELEPLLATALGEGSLAGTDDAAEAILTAQGLGKAASILSMKFDLVATNPPYLGRGNQSDVLKQFCETNYPDAKSDLANVMLERCLKLAKSGCGVVQFVMPQNWIFLRTYASHRHYLVRNKTLQLLARLGPGAFGSISGEVVKAITLTVSNALPEDSSKLSFLDAADQAGPLLKIIHLKSALPTQIQQTDLMRTSISPMNLTGKVSANRIGELARSFAGIDSGDSMRFRQLFWEQWQLAPGWIFNLSSPEKSTPFGGRKQVLFYENGTGSLSQCPGGSIRNVSQWGKSGVAVTRMSSLPVTLSLGESWDRNCAMLVPRDPSHLPALWAFCQSEGFTAAVRDVNQKLSVSEAAFEEVDFDFEQWRGEAAERYPNGLPKPYSDDPTQWLFHGHPQPATEPLQVAVARLLGYAWPAESDEKMELAPEARAWISRSKSLDKHIDEDGIVCIPAVKGEKPAADRLLTLLADAFGDKWTPSLQNELLSKVGFADKGLETWLRDGFFTQHCKVFQDRPFIWHIWDGEKDGFSALVNYHKLTKQTLSTLAHTYLGSWLEEKKKQQTAGVDGAKELVLAAQLLQEKLKRILTGEKPLDIFVRWKPLAQQPLGWEPDLNDGVRMNIRPMLLVGDVGKKGAGVLRDKPKSIKWTKDRGTDAASAPWFDLGPQYAEDKGARINEHHTTLEEKNKARGA